jgi:hypothetical protein
MGVKHRFLFLQNKKSGFSIVGVLIGLGLTVGASILLAGVIAYFRTSEERVDRRLLVQGQLVDTASFFMSWDFEKIVTYCQSKNALDSIGLSSSKCLNSAGNQLNSGPDVGLPTTPDPKPTDIRKNLETGAHDPEGLLCIALNSCIYKVPGQVLEISLIGYWIDPDSRLRLNQTEQIIQRSRW